MRRLFGYIRFVFGLILNGIRLWGLLRLIFVAGVIALLANWDRYIWNELGSEPASLFWLWGLRFWVMPAAALIGAFLAGSLYLQRLYSLRRRRSAWQFLLGAVFSIGVPRLVIQDGQPVLSAGRENLIWLIGGPGRLNVRPGSAVVIETLRKPTRVLGAGLHMLNRPERIREVISLADQHGMDEGVLAPTRDGIELQLQRIQYRYRLQTGRRPRDYRKRTPQDPYPFSSEAARRLAYQRTAFADGRVTPWDGVVRFAVEGVITDYVNANDMDSFATSDKYASAWPRQMIITNMATRNLRERLRTTGTELLWFDIGTFQPNLSDVDSQWVATWGATWSGLASLEQAKAEGKRLSVQEIARAEEQARIFEGIIDMLMQVRLTPNYRENIHRLIVMRTAQILEAMVESNRLVNEREVPEQPPSVTRRREFLDEWPFNPSRRLRWEE